MSDETDLTDEPAASEEELPAGEVSNPVTPYVQRVLSGEIKGPLFTHVAEDGTFTEYTFDEVMASSNSNGEKIAWLSMKAGNMKLEMKNTDYIGIKLAEGAATAEEYAEELASRQTMRDTINTYQDAINTLEAEQ